MIALKKLSSRESSYAIEITWRHLAEAVLVHIITFNRRRQGEVSKMTVEDFSHKCKVDLSSDALETLSSMERSLFKIFTRVELNGKRGRTVPVLLTHKMLKAIYLLLQLIQK